ncbi:16S rRNA (adenine(1518)-N(6)/adenine(1519)-N(6))-dimethyltransferase RsmA [Winkia sp. UMB0889B]|uniref:16S rRNA (adenine(1518)-N(6)/adenine(1519)-N(6))- dimethyltransferase RsmA n=1 Tax=Winkia sp. UMB0889B TaxID=3046315 RepID=UPI00255779A4|nr:16S rRNA (adenine(1518)-N(6)/adenine(1519)-N(6))-dimethyltransferase RsmA [Winkia sp. UMB0889B]MDK7904976.1 16S rRNA (adenine(1518)-N(6)/adenine(1519)-N(6))-dimethyltransferase RsmA [Winkia sp. UMB0889B]
MHVNNSSLEAGLLGPAEVRDICAALGVQPTKVLGQNFVHDASTVRKIVREAGDVAGMHVLEVGPGLGSLTLALLEAGAAVTAVEIDPRLAAALPQTVLARQKEAADRLRILRSDAMEVTEPQKLSAAVPVGDAPSEIFDEPPTHIVANLPYNVAVPVLLTLLEALPTVQTVLVMVQAEVADRLAAGPGSRTYGVPSVKAAWYGDVERAGTVGRAVFWPVPNVDSALVRISRKPSPKADRKEVFALVDAAFNQRRKTLRQALKNYFGSAAKAAEALERAGIDPTRRGETLTVADFVKISQEADS